MRADRDIRAAAALLAPPAVCLTMYGAFRVLSHRFGPVTGYFLGFLLYWIFWCGLFPWWVLGAAEARRLFRGSLHPLGRPAWLGLFALGAPLLLGYGYAFPRAFPYATAPIVAASALLAVVNGAAEELLWRGLYIAKFGDSTLRGHWYPALGFAVWHLAPLSIFPNRAPGGAAAFLLVAGGVGVLWGWLARASRSIRWTTAAHILFDFSGLGGRVYFS